MRVKPALGEQGKTPNSLTIRVIGQQRVFFHISGYRTDYVSGLHTLFITQMLRGAPEFLGQLGSIIGEDFAIRQCPTMHNLPYEDAPEKLPEDVRHYFP
jgi:hypothetical protein